MKKVNDGIGSLGRSQSSNANTDASWSAGLASKVASLPWSTLPNSSCPKSTATSAPSFHFVTCTVTWIRCVPTCIAENPTPSAHLSGGGGGDGGGEGIHHHGGGGGGSEGGGGGGEGGGCEGGERGGLHGGVPGGGGGGEGGMPTNEPSHVTTGTRRGSFLLVRSKNVWALNSKEAEPSGFGWTTSKIKVDAPSPETNSASDEWPMRCSRTSLPKSKLMRTP